MAFDSKSALNHAIKYLADTAIKRNAGGWIPPKEEERQRKEQIRQELQQSREAQKQQQVEQKKQQQIEKQGHKEHHIISAFEKACKEQPFMNCKLAVQMATGIPSITDLPKVTQPKTGDILAYGINHYAVKLDGDKVIDVPEWGGSPQVKTLDDLHQEYDQPTAIHRVPVGAYEFNSAPQKSEGGLILSKQYPTHYMPEVGRQVMQGGGVPDQPQRQLSPLGFYSAAAERAQTLQPKGDAVQMINALKNTQGIKTEELQNAGLIDQSGNVHPDWAGRGKVTREDLVSHLQGQMPQVEETMLGGKRGGTKQEILNYKNPKHSQYTLPGGENYREVLLKLPYQKNEDLEKLQQTLGDLVKKRTDATAEYKRIAEELSPEHPAADEARSKITEYNIPIATIKQGIDQIVEEERRKGFRSGHWDDTNVLAHIRMADRTGPNGEKILHVEELQSDWGQKGKKEGFESKITDMPHMSADDLLKDYQDRMTDNQKKWVGKFLNRWEEVEDTNNRDDLNRLSEEYSDWVSKQKLMGIPSAPYVTSTEGWTDLALKRVLKEAAEGGYDKVVWTPGEEQAKRYDLSKQIDSLKYSPAITSDKTGKSYGGNLVAYKGGHVVFNKEVKSSDELEGMIGKDVTNKLLKTEKQKGESDFRPYHYLEGADLSVGGEGMKGYYDNIVPKRLQNLAKKHDKNARLGYVNLGGIVAPNTELDEFSGAINFDRPKKEKPKLQFNLPSLDITPAMRESILRGQSAYQRGGEVDGNINEDKLVYEPHQRSEEQGYSIRGFHVTQGDKAEQISSAQRFDPYKAALPGEEATFFWDNPEAANKWLHASSGIETFDPERMSERDVGKAERQSSAIMPVRIHPGKTSTIDWQEATGLASYDHQSMKQILRVARKMGFDTLRIKNMHEHKMGEPHDQIAVLNPYVIRSEFAEFNPSRRGEENLGAARGGQIDAYARGGKVHPDLKMEVPIGDTKERMSNMRVDAPVRWASSPDHPSAHLAYITDAEAKLLKKADLHGSNIAHEHHVGPGGIPSYQGGGIGGGGTSYSGGGGGANPGDIAGGGFGSGNVGGGSSGGGGGGGGSGIGSGGGGGGGGGSSGGGGGGGGGSSMPSIGLGSVDAFGAPGSMKTFGSTDPGKESDEAIAKTLAAGMKPGGDIGSTFVREAISPDLSGGNSPLASGISQYDRSALDAQMDRMRAGQQAERDESYERSVIGPVTKQINVPNAGDLYGATNAPLALQPPSGMFGQPTTGTTQFGTGTRQAGFPSQQTGPMDPSQVGYAEQMAKSAREAWLAANTEPESPRLGDLATPTPNRPFATRDQAGSVGSMPIGTTPYMADLTPLSSQPARPITPTPFSTFPQDVQRQMIPNRPDSSYGQTLIDPTGKYTQQALEKMKVAEDAVTMLNSPTLAGSLFRAFTPTPTPATPKQQAAIERMYKGAYGDQGTPAPSSTRSSFNQAFADARARGETTFSWTNPATGKTGLYTTQLARKEGGRVPSLKNPEDWIATVSKPNEVRKVAKAKQYKPQKPRSTAIVERAIMLSSRKS